MDAIQDIQVALDKLSKTELQTLLEGVTRFKKYSFNNQVLIWMQRPNASSLAGFREWQNQGRQVRKGEKSIKIQAPIIVKDKQDENKKKIVGFRMVSVFDISQTDGPEIPKIKMASQRQLDFCQEHYDNLKALIESQNYKVVENSDTGKAYGWCSKNSSGIEIHLSENAKGLEKLATLVHEYAHALLHMENKERNREIEEVEAEGITYAVLSNMGYENSLLEAQLQYIFLHTSKGLDLSKSFEVIKKTAIKILDNLQNNEVLQAA